MKIDGRSLSLEDARRVLRGEETSPRLTGAARKAVRAARAMVVRRVSGDDALYGINTGFGKLSRVRIDADDLEQLQENLLLSHAAGSGRPLPDSVARLSLLLRANTLARGNSGVRVELLERLLELFARGVVPIIPEQGSVGASGDLAPLAHLALLLIGRGEAKLDGKKRSGRWLAKQLGLEPLRLQPKEGLALINGTQISTALAVDALLSAQNLARTADVACAMTIEALRGSARAFDRRIHGLRAHAGQSTVAANVRRLLRGSEVVKSHAGCDRVQDPYALRCAPQVHGAARDTFGHAGGVLEREMNSVTDNPLLFPEDDAILNGGNFHAEPVGMVADFAAIAAAELASISERRIENLVNPDLSGLPPFLARDAGLNSGFMIAQVTAAAIVSENKTLAHPASVDSIPTSAGKEDHVSMATWAGRKFRMIVTNAERVVGIELLAAAQALDLQSPWIEPGKGARAAYDAVRAAIPTLARDREFAPDIERAAALVRDGAVADAAAKAAGRID